MTTTLHPIQAPRESFVGRFRRAMSRPAAEIVAHWSGEDRIRYIESLLSDGPTRDCEE